MHSQIERVVCFNQRMKQAITLSGLSVKAGNVTENIQYCSRISINIQEKKEFQLIIFLFIQKKQSH